MCTGQCACRSGCECASMYERVCVHTCTRVSAGCEGDVPPSVWSLILSCAVCAPRDPSPGGVRKASPKPNPSPWGTGLQTGWEGGQGSARCILSRTEDERGPGGPRLCQRATHLRRVRGDGLPAGGLLTPAAGFLSGPCTCRAGFQDAAWMAAGGRRSEGTGECFLSS